MTENLQRLDREKVLTNLKHWQSVSGRDAISREFIFDNFNSAFGFMAQVALCAEQMDHHPEWFNVYNRVEVILSTHDAGGITQKDLDLAMFMDKLVPS